MGKNRNVIVALGGGPTAVTNNCLLGLLKEAQAQSGIGEVLGAVNGVKGILGEKLVDMKIKSGLMENSYLGPGSFLGSCRREMAEEDYRRILDILEKHEAGFIILMGGEGTMSMLDTLDHYVDERKMEVTMIGVPMTVDNDIKGTDHCLGYGSAARFYSTSVMEVGMDAMSLPPPVTVFETMGRDSGWLAASTIMARRERNDPPHLIFLPERPFDEEWFLNEVSSIYGDLGYVSVVVSEGLKGKTGESLWAEGDANRDEYGHPLYGGVGKYICNLISSRLGLRARDEKPGLLARCCMSQVSRTDRMESFRLGREAVRFALREEARGMLGLRRSGGDSYECEVELISFSEASDGIREVPPCFMAEEGQVSHDFVEYVKPLLGGPLPGYRGPVGI